METIYQRYRDKIHISLDIFGTTLFFYLTILVHNVRQSQSTIFLIFRYLFKHFGCVFLNFHSHFSENLSIDNLNTSINFFVVLILIPLMINLFLWYFYHIFYQSFWVSSSFKPHSSIIFHRTNIITNWEYALPTFSKSPTPKDFYLIISHF